MIPKIIATASNISILWESGNLETKRRIQKLVFPEGVLWDKEISGYRTPETSEFFEIMSRFSDTYINKKETKPLELVSVCGRDTNYRTFVDGFRAVEEFCLWLDDWNE